jgi:hypothetical protein
MLLFKYTDRENGTDTEHCFYESSNILYSRLSDFDTTPLKTLVIVFHEGRTYRYENVDVNDYLLFRESFNPSASDEKSSGKAFWKYIRKYPATRIEDTKPEEIAKMMNEQKIRSVNLTHSTV